MPGPVDELILPARTQSVTISLEPVANVLYSLTLLLKVEHLSGLGDWVTTTSAALTPEEREELKLVMDGLHYAAVPEKSWSSFPAYLEYLASRDAKGLRDQLLRAYARVPPLGARECWKMEQEPLAVDLEAALASERAYLDFLRERFDANHLDEELETRAYAYVLDPAAMQRLIVSHLRAMWEKYLRPEWARVTPMLQDAVQACQQLELSDKSRLEAAQLITGQMLEGEKWEAAFENAKRVVFVPSAHVGPYHGKLFGGDTLWVMFGARLPAGISFYAPDLSRAEIVVRLNALADDTRLRMLKLISEIGERRSQDLMQQLDLSQSAASRHLKQLSATGYLSERRCNGAKCYTVNPDRIANTLKAVENFLLTP
jgi:DNA-binding transcriptional ArsR family regulator